MGAKSRPEGWRVDICLKRDNEGRYCKHSDTNKCKDCLRGHLFEPREETYENSHSNTSQRGQ